MKSLLTMQGMMFLMILIGAGMRKIQIVTTEGRRSMTNLVVNLILPSNILYAFSKADASAFRSDGFSDPAGLVPLKQGALERDG